MGTISVHLENGFTHDDVTLSAGDTRLTESDVTTRYQIGLARTVDVEVPDGSVELTIALPGRGLTASVQIDPTSTPHVRADVEDAALTLVPQPDPPRYA